MYLEDGDIADITYNSIDYYETHITKKSRALGVN